MSNYAARSVYKDVVARVGNSQTVGEEPDNMRVMITSNFGT
jgi:hypothetical protein